MKATINKNDILPVLAKIQGLAGRKTNLAITTNVLIQTSESGISISATDLETGFEGFYPAQVDAQGLADIGAPARTGDRTVSVLGHAHPGPGHHEGGTGGHIEGMGLVPARAAGV